MYVLRFLIQLKHSPRLAQNVLTLDVEILTLRYLHKITRPIQN